MNMSRIINIESFIKIKFKAKQPFTHIRISENGHEILYYEDILIRYEYDLTTQEVLKNDCKKKRSNSDLFQLKLDKAKLLFRLKNM